MKGHVEDQNHYIIIVPRNVYNGVKYFSEAKKKWKVLKLKWFQIDKLQHNICNSIILLLFLEIIRIVKSAHLKTIQI